MNERFKLYAGDCLELMRQLPDASVDLILCDLPYGTTQNKWDSVIDLVSLWGQYKRIAKKNAAVVLTAQSPFDKVLGASNLTMLRYEWIWEKWKATGHLNSKRAPMKAHENVLVFVQNLQHITPKKHRVTHTRGRVAGLRKTLMVLFPQDAKVAKTDRAILGQLSGCSTKQNHSTQPKSPSH